MSTTTIHILISKRTPRVMYVIAEVFERRLGLTTKVWTDLDDFETQTGPKFNYSDLESSEGIPKLVPSGILFEKRIQIQDLEAGDAELPILFPRKGHALGFDPLAASFFLLSRYEEYLPHRSDEHGRYDSNQSILIQRKWQHMPLVEMYSEKLATWLHQSYPSIPGLRGEFKPMITVDVDQIFAMKAKGLVRSMVATAKDTVMGRGVQRANVMLGRKPDPNDMYDRLLESCKSAVVEPLFFFQVGESSRFDINNPPHLNEVRQRINEIALRSRVGIHPSYYSSTKQGTIAKELERLREITSESIQVSRQHYLRFQLPRTFHELADLGIQEEYSMGYHEFNGFRAGTCWPFKLFDLEKEEVVDITLYPTAWMDLTAIRLHPREEDAWQELLDLKEITAKYKGYLITTWHPEVLVASNEDYSSWNIFDRLIEHV